MVIMRGLLHRIARRCPVHDKPSPRYIRELEQSLGYASLTAEAALSWVEEFADLRMIDCGHSWCHSKE